jgi:3-keto-5-aminohexanoate cleavage enzyme
LTDPAHLHFSREHLVVMSAPNGARRMPEDHAALPLTSAEIAECASSLTEQSVAVLHLHVRDDENQHTLDPDRYRDATKAVRSAVGENMIVQITTEAVGRFKPDEQMEVVRQVRPEAVSLALRELCADESAESTAGRFFEWLVRERIWPQYILYSVDDVLRFERFRRKGLFAEDYPFCMLVLGQYADGQEGQAADLDAMLEAGADQSPWAVCCFGEHENAAALHAASAGGHVRLGFENNVLLQDGSLAVDNTALIAQFHASRDDDTRRAATAEEIREQWLTF